MDADDTGSRQAKQRLDREVEFFDKFAAENGDYDVLGEAAYDRLTGLFEERVHPRPGERCIDLGCGTGSFTRRLARFGLQRTGMDISRVSVARAKQLCEDARFVVGDITKTGLAEGSFDLVVYSGVLHHFGSSAERREVLAEGHRILAPGGRMFAFDPNQHSPSMWLYRDPRSPLSSRKGMTENEVLLRRSELEEEIRSAGFAEITVHGASGISFRYVKSAVARAILPLYNLYEWATRYSQFEAQIGTFIVSSATKR